jgi:hypothetical protein
MTREDEIKEIAYHIWERDGCQTGNDIRYWLHAEMIWETRQKHPELAANDPGGQAPE